MPWHIGTQGQCRAAVAQINGGLGYPKTATLADRIGGGVHVPLAEVPVTSRWSFIARLSDGTFGVRIEPAAFAQLTPPALARVVADLPDGVTITQEDED